MRNILYLKDIEQLCTNTLNIPDNIELVFQPLQQIFNGNEKIFYAIEIKKSRKRPDATIIPKKFTKSMVVFSNEIDIIAELTDKLIYVKDYYESAILVIHAPIDDADYMDTIAVYNYNQQSKAQSRHNSEPYKFIFCKNSTTSYGMKCIANISSSVNNTWLPEVRKNIEENFDLVYEFFKNSDDFIFSSAANKYIKRKPDSHERPPMDFCLFLDDPNDLAYFAFSTYQVAKVFITISCFDDIKKYV